MKSIEQAKKIYQFCIVSAKKGKTTSYGDVLNYLGYGSNIPGHAIRYGLELAWIACADMSLPIVTSIVVNQATGEPSADGYPVKSWESDAQDVFNRDKWPSVDAIDWDFVWDNRKELSEKYGTRGYWKK